MQLQQAVENIFDQLGASLERLSTAEYIQPCNWLQDQSIGQHVRHIIELFQGLELGYSKGLINYDSRKRDRRIETDKALARMLLTEICSSLSKPNKFLQLETHYDGDSAGSTIITTNYYREIAYNLEHAIHHMALIRIGINEVSSIPVSADFGVASSTIKHRRQCAQ
jgi:hypothetical protein